MKLKEFEAKEVLSSAGIEVPEYQLIRDHSQLPEFSGEKMIKVQACEGKRGKAGGIKTVKNKDEAAEFIETFLDKPFRDEHVSEIMIADKIDIKKELFAAIMFDTFKRSPVLLFSESGGIDVEDSGTEKMIKHEIDYLYGLRKQEAEEILAGTGLEMAVKETIIGFLLKLYHCFTKFDCKMIEINPLAITNKDKIAVIDASIVLDENADFRRSIKFPERTGLRKATEREIAAKKIDKDDYRGVAGKTFLDLDGDIGILASGGGASITLMDALERFGGKPANYTEYSGDPPKEKVEKLAKIVLSKPGLSGLLVAGVIANFTDIAETMKGIIGALKDAKPDYPIVVRRAGPNDKEAKGLLAEAKEKYGLDIHYFDENMPLTKAAEMMVELSNKYKEMRNYNTKKWQS